MCLFPTVFTGHRVNERACPAITRTNHVFSHRVTRNPELCVGHLCRCVPWPVAKTQRGHVMLAPALWLCRLLERKAVQLLGMSGPKVGPSSHNSAYISFQPSLHGCANAAGVTAKPAKQSATRGRCHHTQCCSTKKRGRLHLGTRQGHSRSSEASSTRHMCRAPLRAWCLQGVLGKSRQLGRTAELARESVLAGTPACFARRRQCVKFMIMACQGRQIPQINWLVEGFGTQESEVHVGHCRGVP